MIEKIHVPCWFHLIGTRHGVFIVHNLKDKASLSRVRNNQNCEDYSFSSVSLACCVVCSTQLNLLSGSVSHLQNQCVPLVVFPNQSFLIAKCKSPVSWKELSASVEQVEWWFYSNPIVLVVEIIIIILILNIIYHCHVPSIL